MTNRIVLASSSEIRQQLLRNAGVRFETAPVVVDEVAIRDALIAEGAGPRDIADALAEHKARKGGGRDPEALVIGCDQVLAFRNQILGKAETPDEALAQLNQLGGEIHELLSAAVIYHEGQPVWRHIGRVKMHMRRPDQNYLNDYVARNWKSIRNSVGGYKLEEEGSRLFHRIDGDYFTVLGLPLFELLGYLTLRGAIPG
ncbi:MAG: nucleoside triphosphate pyrophosphatase [Rhodobacter sp.]|nr:nucleoside triphosphate pyrophosphatase [Rhodobacter sp.]